MSDEEARQAAVDRAVLRELYGMPVDPARITRQKAIKLIERRIKKADAELREDSPAVKAARKEVRRQKRRRAKDAVRRAEALHAENRADVST